MDDIIQDMINRGLVSIDTRYILSSIPVWFASLIQLENDWLYWIDYIKCNVN
jgi:hypothetical protein